MPPLGRKLRALSVMSDRSTASRYLPLYFRRPLHCRQMRNESRSARRKSMGAGSGSNEAP